MSEKTRVVAGEDLDLGELTVTLHDIADRIGGSVKTTNAEATQKYPGDGVEMAELTIEYVVTEDAEHLMEPLSTGPGESE